MISKAHAKDDMNHQHLSITHEIYKSLDDGMEVWNVFLDISKSFDKVWYEGIIFNCNKTVYL